FGKKIGGDIIEQKKTLLFIFTQAKLNGDQKLEFENVFFSDKIDDLEKINSIKQVY
ncbi:MAG: polyprenyl synthetase family protein, partial [Desulfobacula sp.]|nr:polyprenyl synthetase family protein [Desulfobacula sp.]